MKLWVIKVEIDGFQSHELPVYIFRNKPSEEYVYDLLVDQGWIDPEKIEIWSDWWWYEASETLIIENKT